MSLAATGIIGAILLMALVFSGNPVCWVILLVGVGGLAYLTSPSNALALAAIDFQSLFAWYPFTMIPLFFLLGFLAAETGITRDIFAAARAWVGRFPGGLAIATQVASAGLGAISGSPVTSAGTMAAVAYPEMVRYGYAPSLACASIAAGGILSPIIPPSIILILYALITENSVGRLFAGGILPGLMFMSLYSFVIVFTVRRHPALAPLAEPATWRERLNSLRGGVVEILLIFLGIMGALMFGIATATEIAAFGVIVLMLVTLLRRRLTWQAFNAALRQTTSVTALLFMSLAAVTVLGRFLTVTQIPVQIADFAASGYLPDILIIAGLLLFYFALGFFMEPIMIVVVTLPFFYPAVLATGFDVIAFGICVAATAAVGGITPPVGIMVYVVKVVVKDVPLSTIFSGVWPFVWTTLVGVAIMVIFPQIVSFLPNILFPVAGG